MDYTDFIHTTVQKMDWTNLWDAMCL